MRVQPWITRAARRRPGVVAVDAPDGALTYAELDVRAGAAAAHLRALGVRHGDRVGLALPASLGFAVALHACLALGAAAVPVDLRLGAGERARRAATCALVLDEAPGAAVAAHSGTPASRRRPGPGSARAIGLDAAAVVLFTSGSTAAPKEVVLTAGNWLWNAIGSAVALGLDPGERWLCALPLSHVGGLSILLRSAVYGTTAVLHDRFDAERIAADLTRPDGPTMVSVVPTTLGRLLDAGLRRPPGLRAALTGGGPIPPALLARAAEAGVPVVTTYGLTEACSQVTTGGPPLFCTRVRVHADPGPGRAGAEGEVLVAGPTVAPAATAPDGWLHTGDLGRLDAGGTLHITGRASDIIVSGGENVAPAEVEAVLEAHPAVAEAAVHGRPDPEWGEAVVATVVLRPGARADAEDLRRHARARLAGFKVPKTIGFAGALPRTPSGKLLRRAL